MKEFTGWQYLLIDVANHFGLDKTTFETRIQWAEDNLDDLEGFVIDAAEPELFTKTVMAIRSAQRGEQTGHLVAMDAVCSGIQIMSVLTGCVEGAKATGCVNPDVRADAYHLVSVAMNAALKAMGLADVSFPRKIVKNAVMTRMYGSEKVPERHFGVMTPELQAFYAACFKVAPGASVLLDELLGTWKPYALIHEWTLPDGFEAKVKVMKTVIEEGIEVDELDHASFTYEYRVNEGKETGKSNAANVVHSVDAYLLRSLLRRCSYDEEGVSRISALVSAELLERASTGFSGHPDFADVDTWSHVLRFKATRMADTVILPYLNPMTVKALSTTHLQMLNRIMHMMLERKPCDVVTIHDSFASHPNHVNTVRYWYKELLAELADSEVLSDLMNQLHSCAGYYAKRSQNLGAMIRKSNYALS